jgi:hypothetical protein
MTRIASCLAVVAIAIAIPARAFAADDLVQLDPFAQATDGHPKCPPVAPPLMTREQVERSAHARAERGTRCAMEGTCEPGGAYRRDPEINEAVRAAIAADPRFEGASIWLTTSRGWVTLQGCVRNTRQRDQLVAAVKEVPRVVLVFDETRLIPVNAPPRRRAS